MSPDQNERLVVALEKIATALAASPRPVAGNRSAPGEPPGICPIHAAPWKWVPPGVSRRNNKPYAGFWACPERNCDERPDDHREAEAKDQAGW